MDVRANQTTLFVEASGEGTPVVFVHGSWGDHHNWDLVAPAIAATNRVVTFDRRGHSQSKRPGGNGSVHDDVEDLGALIEALDLPPTHLVGNSFGAIICLHLAAERPELIRSLFVHEPPLVGVLAGDDDLAPIVEVFNARAGAVVQRLERGDMAGGAQQFVEEVALGPGAWDRLPAAAQETFITNAPTWLEEMQDPNVLDFDLARLNRFDRPTLLSEGGQSPPMFGPIMERLAKAIPTVARHVFADAGHVPHMSHATDYTATLRSFLTAS